MVAGGLGVGELAGDWVYPGVVAWIGSVVLLVGRAGRRARWRRRIVATWMRCLGVRERWAGLRVAERWLCGWA